MSAMGFIKGLWKAKGWLTLGGLGAYIWSASEDDPEKRVFKNATDNLITGVAGPALYKAGEVATKGLGNIAGSLIPSDDNKKPGVDKPVRDGLGDLMEGVQPYVTAGIDAAQAAPQNIPQFAGKAGELAGTAVDTSANSLEKFLKGILPESLMPPKWLLYTGAAVLGAAGIGSATGFNAFNLGTAATLAMAPFKFVGTALGSALGPLITGGAILAGFGLLISPTMRQMAWDLAEGLANLLPGKQKEGHTPEPAAPARAAEPAKPEAAPAVPAPTTVSQVEVNPELMRGVAGGAQADTIVMREIPAELRNNPSRDSRNTPNFTAAV